jgi:hypothetical protein
MLFPTLCTSSLKVGITNDANIHDTDALPSKYVVTVTTINLIAQTINE